MILPTVCFNPVVMILHNTKTDRYHPILFWETPPPSGKLGDELRWKSVAHHTTGFDTLEEAINGKKGVLELCKSQQDELKGGDVYHKLDELISWDGEGIPAMVERFDLITLDKHKQ